MVRKLKIGSFNSTFVFRHRWEKNDDRCDWEIRQLRREYKLGIWFKKGQAVGLVRKGKDREETIKKTFTKSNHVNCYMIGMDLIFCKMWVDFSFKPLMKL